jgi:uncharacterized protein (DUF1800 family)
MCNFLTKHQQLPLAILCLSLLGLGSLHGQMLDLNGDGMSDIWELLFDANGIDPNADSDRDGVSNRLEALAGTNPFDANSCPRITLVTSAGTNFIAGMPAALGKRYQLQSALALDGASLSNWVTEATMVARTGSVVTLSAPISSSSRFFRISISDVDTDGDGLNDWEEYQLGLDPLNAYSNGQLDANNQPLSDYAYVTGRLAAQNVVTIVATTPLATQPDPGQTALNAGVFTVTRGGFPLTSRVINLGVPGLGIGAAIEGLDHAVLPRTLLFPAGISSQTIPLIPLADTNLLSSVVATLSVLPGSGYSVGNPNKASIVIYRSPTPAGTGLTGQYFRGSSSTYSNSANFNPTNLALTRMDSTVDFVWGTISTPITNNGTYTVRWTGQVLPEFSETYYFDVSAEDGVKLWVNDRLIIDKWVVGANETVGSVNLQEGVRYNIRMDYFHSTGNAAAHLSWYSPDQPKQVIPASRLYPASATAAPTAPLNSLSAYAFLGQPFSYTVSAANTPLAYTAAGLPAGLSFNPTNGLISGIPTLAGDYQVTLTASNAVGVGASVMDLQVIDTGSSVTREVWTGVAGSNVADIPVDVPAPLTNTLGTLEGISNYGVNYGERIRGYLTAPVSGNYYFWIAGSDAAELWVSNDGEPANKVRRASVLPAPSPLPPHANGTGPHQWNLQPNQRSGWLKLAAGQRFYVEILHKAGAGTNDNWSVAWLQDPTGTNFNPGVVVPGYVLSRYLPLPSSHAPGTLYSANMLAQGNSSTAAGSATLRLSADGSQAILNFNYSGLSSPKTGEHIHCDPYLNNPSQIIFDIDTAPRQADGSYVWNITPIGSFTSAADIVELIREGKAYLNVHTVNYPAGEINGHFTAANGTPSFTPPPAPPAWEDDHTNAAAAARFLIQATFGPTPPDIALVQSLGYDGWLSNQFVLPISHHLPVVLANRNQDPTTPYPSSLTFSTWWQQSVTAPDQLRQRVAFALSEIMVVSENGSLQNFAQALSAYYDTLLDNAFGNYRTLLKAVTLNPAMGIYLDMRGNDMGSMITGVHANENYAREIQQLFSFGLNRMWPDGTLVMDSHGNLVPTYDQNVVMGFAAVFTGWNYYQANQSNGRLPSNWFPAGNYTSPMVLVPTHHDLGTKQLLDNVVLPQAWGSQASSSSTNFDIYGLQDLEAAMDSIFYNLNVGPFICRQLIQRLVTSNPSRDYLYRVVQVFGNDGTGTRGNLQAVIRAILLDNEARSSVISFDKTYGKQREPLLRATAPARAFLPAYSVGGIYSQSGSQLVAITTTNAHRLNNGDVVVLNFTDTSGQPTPANEPYSVTVTSPTNFTITPPGLATGSYVQNTNLITINISGHGLLPGNAIYLVFTTGGAATGLYQVITNTDSAHFTVATPDAAKRSGNCLLPRISLSGNGGYTQSRTNITVDVPYSHGLQVGESISVNFTSGNPLPASGQYQVATVPDATHFTIVVALSANQSQNSLTIYPLAAPSLVRAGLVSAQESTWNMGTTDNSLSQTPLRSPTVFNFFFPDFQFPGPLASAGLTTPEFQLTADTHVASQMNFLEGGLLNNTGNTNGLSSFSGGNGAVVMDLGPWMTTAYTANATAVGNLVDALNTLLVGGQLTASAKPLIVNYVSNPGNFPYGSPPTYSQMRDRVRAVVHLIVTSPDFTILK